MPDQNTADITASPAAARINTYAKRFQAAKYLEIGVRNGATFFFVNMPLKVAVDPAFRFNPDAYAQTGALYLPVTSDEFFASFSEHPQSALFFEPDGRIAFDIIYFGGLHTFEQSLRDFESSRKFCHQNTIWIIDNTVPSDVFSAIPDKIRALDSRKCAGAVSGAWHGDVYKTLLAIHDFHPEISYCTVMDKGNPQTILWQAPTLPDRKPRFSSLQEIAALGYVAVLEHADLFLPVSDSLAAVLIGKSLAPTLYANAKTWKQMLYRKLTSAEEDSLKKQVDEHAKTIATLEKKNASMVSPLATHRTVFPNSTQKFILACCKPFIRLFAPLEYLIQFECNPSDFFYGTKYFGSNLLRAFLSCFGPKPEKMNFPMKTVRKFLNT